MTLGPAQWLKRVDQAILALEAHPQCTLPSPFPTQALEQLLQNMLHVSDIKLSIEEKGWMTAQEAWLGQGEGVIPLTIAMTPLEDPVLFLVNRVEMGAFMGKSLGGDPADVALYDPALTEGFINYFTLEVLRAIADQGFAKPLALRLAKISSKIKATFTESPLLVYDVRCQFSSQVLWGRLLLLETFRKGWEQTFTRALAPTLDPRWQELPIELGLEIGSTELAVEEWQRVRVGDVVLLDQCSYFPHHGKGSAILTLGERPLFRGKFKDEALQLVEFPHAELGGEMEEESIEEEPKEVESTPTEELAVTIQSVPMHIVVEVSRLTLTVQELSHLAVGSVLSLEQLPNAGVTLRVHGKKIGQGELIAVGEVLGVRIVSLA